MKFCTLKQSGQNGNSLLRWGVFIKEEQDKDREPLSGYSRKNICYNQGVKWGHGPKNRETVDRNRILFP